MEGIYWENEKWIGPHSFAKLGHELGEGTYGTVYHCWEISTGIEYAMKIIKKDFEGPPE